MRLRSPRARRLPGRGGNNHRIMSGKVYFFKVFLPRVSTGADLQSRCMSMITRAVVSAFIGELIGQAYGSALILVCDMSMSCCCYVSLLFPTRLM